MKIGSQSNGHIFADWRIEGGQLVRTMRQPSEDAILSFNDEIRKNPEAVKRLDWGRWVASIPENVFWYLVTHHDPELNAPNAETRTAAWMRLLNSREFERFRITDRSLARG